MKKRIIIFISALTVFSLMAFGYMNWNSSLADQNESSNSKSLAIDKPVEEDNNFNVFSDFIYDVGPRFGPIKKGGPR